MTYFKIAQIIGDLLAPAFLIYKIILGKELTVNFKFKYIQTNNYGTLNTLQRI